ncbi:Bud-site selection protein [Pleomassaria siparia CBS 279.74]|uniref:Bud-site selection protein n=1 Tax=Pleomassaria siparia CBS 279.74 TaxID=1314801 RepID=A0A6G1KLK9_9PLEO|nr:Bud-site selection protein [Pleomassaria siparia CBS 279.74]
MPKRKRDDPSASSTTPKVSAPPTSRELARQKKLCTARLETAQKDLLSALRFGAGFERQKYSRRKKTAKGASDSKAAARIDAEYAALKAVDFPKVADQHLRKTIARVTSIKDSEALKDAIGELEKGSQDPVTLNVHARLFNGAGVKKVMDKVVEDLKGILGVGGVGVRPAKEQDIKKARLQETVDEEDEVDEEEEEEEDLGYDDGDVFSAFNARIAAPSSVEGDSDDSLSDGHRPPSIDASEGDDGDDSDEVVDDFALGSEDVSDEDSGSEAINPDTIDAALESSDLEEQLNPAPKVKKAKALKEPISKSTFLPSLSHAAYYSGTDSEASDLDVDLAPRKNRRGQKARQAIWEKKYGDKAKHKEKEDRNKGWDAKKGAVDTKKNRRGRGVELSGENAMPLGGEKKEKKKEKTRDDVGVLHPSWLAAKAAKEKKVAVKPLGKKIVFD